MRRLRYIFVAFSCTWLLVLMGAQCVLYPPSALVRYLVEKPNEWAEFQEIQKQLFDLLTNSNFKE